MFTPNEYGLFSMPTLETPRLILRRMTMKDAKDIFEYSRDEEVACHVLWSAQRDIGEAKDYCRYRADEPSSWGIIDRQTRHLVGTIGYMDYSMDNASVEIGYSLARWLWNGGYMTEALARVIDYTFESMDINRIEAQHELDNPASGRVMEKCGMRFAPAALQQGEICGRGALRDSQERSKKTGWGSVPNPARELSFPDLPPRFAAV